MWYQVYALDWGTIIAASHTLDLLCGSCGVCCMCSYFTNVFDHVKFRMWFPVCTFMIPFFIPCNWKIIYFSFYDINWFLAVSCTSINFFHIRQNVIVINFSKSILHMNTSNTNSSQTVWPSKKNDGSNIKKSAAIKLCMQLALGRCETHSNPIVLLFLNDICKNIEMELFKQKRFIAAIKRLRCQVFQQYFLIDETCS